MPSDLNIKDRQVSAVTANSRTQWDRVSRNLGATTTSSSSRVTVVEEPAPPVYEPALEPPAVAAHILSARVRFQAVPWEHGARPEPARPAKPERLGRVAPAPEVRRAGPLTAQERFSTIPWVEGAREEVTPSELVLDLEVLAQAAEERAGTLKLSAFFKDAKW